MAVKYHEPEARATNTNAEKKLCQDLWQSPTMAATKTKLSASRLSFQREPVDSETVQRLSPWPLSKRFGAALTSGRPVRTSKASSTKITREDGLEKRDMGAGIGHVQLLRRPLAFK
ncbi:hypothetical protein [Rhodoferax sp. BLA1]|uniref:hypothetical protein n=1 Tax=Rhodoferax sp. BLA1 TaxID=2576062 RepID=UPI0015D2CCA7|nr:hypothetical protein [Rhodoferax sp. BLA1]